MSSIFGKSKKTESVTEKSKGLFSSFDIVLGAILGGLFVSSYLFGENEIEMGNVKKGNLFKVLGIVFSIFVVLLNVYMKKYHPERVNNDFGFISSGLGLLLGSLQRKRIQKYTEQGLKHRSKWPTICIVWIILVLLILILSFI
ncbi:MAG: hypothetical protein WCO35_03865 [Candidatus Nomurabacteria bacterium]